MKKIENDELIRQLYWRVSVKKFDNTRKIPDSDWKTLEEVLRLSPSSYGLQPWKFIVVTDPGLKERLQAVSWNQKQVADCSHYVVFCRREALDDAYLDKYIREISSVRGGSPESLEGFKQNMLRNIRGRDLDHLKEWNSQQVYIALGSLITAAAMLGIDTCPMEGFEKEACDELLELQDSGYRSVVCCALGYRHPDDTASRKKKVRFSTPDLFSFR